jgi:predicted nucleic acid-binding protein
MKNVLIDTDVILDFFFDRKPFSGYAANILSLCETGEISGYLTPVMVSNIYYLLRQTAAHEKVTDKLNQLLQILEVLPIDKKVVHQSLKSDFKDFEDALQNYSAQNSGIIEIIITRNIKDYKRSSLIVMTPEIFLKAIEIQK